MIRNQMREEFMWTKNFIKIFRGGENFSKMERISFFLEPNWQRVMPSISLLTPPQIAAMELIFAANGFAANGHHS